MSENANTESTRARKKLLLGVAPMFPRFSEQAIAADCLAWVIDVARQTAPEWSLQSGRWILVRSETGRKRLESACDLDVPLSSAPMVLIRLEDTLAWKSAPQHTQEMVVSKKITEEQGREVLRHVQEYYSSSPEIAQRTAVANGLLAAQEVLLGAASRGLWAYPVTEYDEARIKTHFHIPDQFTVAALLPIGYRQEAPKPPGSQPAPPALIYEEKFGNSFNP